MSLDSETDEQDPLRLIQSCYHHEGSSKNIPICLPVMPTNGNPSSLPLTFVEGMGSISMDGHPASVNHEKLFHFPGVSGARYQDTDQNWDPEYSTASGAPELEPAPTTAVHTSFKPMCWNPLGRKPLISTDPRTQSKRDQDRKYQAASRLRRVTKTANLEQQCRALPQLTKDTEIATQLNELMRQYATILEDMLQIPAHERFSLYNSPTAEGIQPFMESYLEARH